MSKKVTKLTKVKSFYVTILKKLEKLLNKDELKHQFSFLRGIKKKTAKKILELGLANSDIPFLPVLCCSVTRGTTKMRQLDFIEYFDEKRIKRTSILGISLDMVEDKKEEKIKHDIRPHCIIGVELNLNFKGLNARTALIKIRDNGQRPLTFIEIITLAIYYPELLKDHDLIACGSNYGKLGRSVPCLALVNGIPTVISRIIEGIDSRQIFPSCTERVEVGLLDSASTILKFRTIKDPKPL